MHSCAPHKRPDADEVRVVEDTHIDRSDARHTRWAMQVRHLRKGYQFMLITHVATTIVCFYSVYVLYTNVKFIHRPTRPAHICDSYHLWS
jgi:hypothetical protein